MNVSRYLTYFLGTRRKQWQFLIFLTFFILIIIGYFYLPFLDGEYSKTDFEILFYDPVYVKNKSTTSRSLSLATSSLNGDYGVGTHYSGNVQGYKELHGTTLHLSMQSRTHNMREKQRMQTRVGSFINKVKKKHKELEVNVSYNIHIFYYAWYGNPQTDGKYVHWNHQYLPHWRKEVASRYKKGMHTPPDDIGSDFYPQLGCYSSSDNNIIRDHMQQVRKSGSGVLVVSWYPKNQSDQQGIPVDNLVPKLLDIADEFGLKVTLHIEPYKGRNEETLRNDAVYIHKKYFKHPAFYKYTTSDNRLLPLLYIYDSYHTSPSDWAKLLKPEGELSIRNTPYDCIMIALIVEFNHKDYITIGGFDGLYTYFAVNGFTYGSRWSAWSRLKSFSSQTGTIFIPSVGPGYIDTSIRPWNFENTRSRQNGEYYRRSFEAALSVAPQIISVTSFNEWHEGTQIEEAVPKSRLGFRYKDYSPNKPDFYLKLTREYVNNFMSTG